MKKKIINGLLIITATILVLYFSMKDDYKTIINTIVNIDKIYLLIGFFLIFSYWFFKSIVMWIIVHNYKNEYRFRNSFQMILKTNFFHAITPFATGGQPYEIYSLKKSGLKITDSTNVSVQTFITYQISLVLLGIIAIVANYYLNLFPDNKILSRLVTLGFIINFLVIVMLFVLTFTKKISKTIVSFILKILSKTKLIKDKENVKTRFENYLKDFYEGTKKILENKYKFIGCIALQFISLVSLYLIPFALFYGTGLYINPLIVIATSAYVMLIGSFVPIPGGTGGLEYGFVLFFSNFSTGNIVAAIMLLWRFITYYFGMILGAILLGIGKKDKK